MDNLRERTLSGLFWNLAERLGIRIIQFVPALLLARLLSPEQFGLVGMLSIFVILTQLFLDSGFGTALIQKKDATYLDECSIFYFNIFVGGLSVLALFFIAPLVANFYNQPILTGLLRWLAIDILITAFGLIQSTVLTRKMNFKALLKANLLATLAGGAIGVLAAYRGMGVWSLVLQTISNTVFQTIALWMVCDWRPSFIFSLASLRGMFGFGSRMLSASLISAFFDNLYQVLIGKVFSATSLGYYTRAASLRAITLDTTSDVLGRVLYPALATIQDNTERLKRAYRKAMMLATFFHFPLMIGLIVVARPLITLLYSEKWENSIIFFQLMCAAGILYPLHLLNLSILKAKGRSDLYLNLNFIRRGLMIANVLITYRWGISAILTGQVALTFTSYLLNSYYSKVLIGYSIKSQVLDVLPPFMFSVLMGAGMLLANVALNISSPASLLIVQTGIGLLLYLGLNWVSKSMAWLEIIELAKKQWSVMRATG